MNENEKSEINENKEEKKLKHKAIISVAAVLSAGILFLVIHRIYEQNKVYSSYLVEYNMDMAENIDNVYYSYGSGILRYSSDGVAYIEEGKEVWNHGFEIKVPVMDICGDYIAIAEEGANDINIYGIGGEHYQVSASYPISGIEVSRQGVVAAVLEDESANYIEVMSKNGTQIAIGRTVLQGDGYPIDISLSADATKVAASYLSVASGEAQTRVVFYNYSEVGQNETDRIVGGFNDFKDSIVPDIEFVSEDTVLAVGDNLFVIYQIEETPSEKAKVKVDQEIKSVIYNDRYIGMVTEEGDTGKQILNVYRMKDGEKILSQKLDFSYTEIKLVKENILLHNENQCRVISVKGVTKFDYNFGMGITAMVPVDDITYMLVSGGTIQKIRLS